MKACMFVEVVGGVSESDIKGDGDDFLVWKFCDLEGAFTFNSCSGLCGCSGL